jgi:hypothetical protein
MRRLTMECLMAALLVPAGVGISALAQEPPGEPTPEPGRPQQPQPEETAEERDERFARYMTGAKLVGRFTRVTADQAARPDAEGMPEEEYLIKRCEKLPQENLFRFTARIRYGETDIEVPMDLPVQWADRTPVITLDNLWIPGLGTFSSRVLIHDGRYAGTWQHGDRGGHLFGAIQREESQRPESEPQEP